MYDYNTQFLRKLEVSGIESNETQDSFSMQVKTIKELVNWVNKYCLRGQIVLLTTRSEELYNGIGEMHLVC